jgi:uncharacterized protein YoxC
MMFKLLVLTRLEKILMNQDELAKGLADVGTQVAKIGSESTATLQKVAELEAALNNAGGVSPAVQSAFNALKAQVQVVDDLIPDVPAAAPAPATPPVSPLVG